MGFFETVGLTIWEQIGPNLEQKFNELWPKLEAKIEKKFDEVWPRLMEKIEDKFDEYMPKIMKAVLIAIATAFANFGQRTGDKITDLIPGTLDDAFFDPIVADAMNKLRDMRFGL